MHRGSASTSQIDPPMTDATFMTMRVWMLALLVGSTATAKPAASLTREFQAGVDAFRLGQLDDARAHLEKARKLDPKLPGPHRFLAAVAHSQEKFDECVAEGHEALRLNPNSSEASETKKLYDTCRGSAGRAPYRGSALGSAAAIAVITDIPGATVKINKLSYGGTPLAPRRISAGPLEIEITKTGYKPLHVRVDALAGIVNDVVVDLEATK
jgi:tetratricopeptide (TPR) repeat protein